MCFDRQVRKRVGGVGWGILLPDAAFLCTVILQARMVSKEGKRMEKKTRAKSREGHRVGSEAAG